MSIKLFNFGLEELDNIIEEIQAQDDPYFTDDDSLELYNTCLYLMEEFIKNNQDKYNLQKASRPITDFIDDLSTWYLRRSRDRFTNAG